MTVTAPYGFIVLATEPQASKAAHAFGQFILSATGQAVLGEHGFRPATI